MMGTDWEGERQGLVHKLLEWEYVKSPAVKAAFLRVPRERFIPEDLRGSAYDDAPLPIGHGHRGRAPDPKGWEGAAGGGRAGRPPGGRAPPQPDACDRPKALRFEVGHPGGHRLRVRPVDRHRRVARLEGHGVGGEWVHASSGSSRYTGSSGRGSSPSPTIRSMSHSVTSPKKIRQFLPLRGTTGSQEDRRNPAAW